MLPDKFLLTLALAFANGQVLSQPQRAVDTNAYEIINATNNKVTFYNASVDEDIQVNAKERTVFPYTIDTSANWIIGVPKSEYPTKPTNFYYIYNAPDFEEPVTVTFYEGSTYWNFEFQGYGPSTGLQIGTYESLNGKSLYLNNNTITNTLFTSKVGEVTEVNLLQGYTAKLKKKDGTITPTTSSLTARVTELPTGYVNYVEIYTTINNDIQMIATNVDPRTMNNNDIHPQPYLIYWGNYTNEAIFQSGHKTVKYGTLNGQDPYFFTSQNSGYMAEEGDFTNTGDGWTALKVGIDLVRQSFNVVSSFFSWVIFPGITLGLLLLFPILITMFIWLIKLIKKG